MADEFDERLKLWAGQLPSTFRDALIEVADTLDFAVTIAETRLGDKWTSADAIAICQMVLARQREIVTASQDDDE